MKRTTESARENDSESADLASDDARRTRRAAGDLQRRVGNQGIQRLLERGVLQPKLTVSAPDDPSEREAERVADEVTRAEAPSKAENADVDVQGRASAEAEPVGTDLERDLGSFSGGGRPLDRVTRAFFEPRFGRDFGDVRVHTGPRANDAAESIDATAFTIGRDVVFRSGEFRPETRPGKRLLAHELAHVVQQGSAGERTESNDVRVTQGRRSETTGQSSQSASTDGPRPIARPADPGAVVNRQVEQDRREEEEEGTYQRTGNLVKFTPHGSDESFVGHSRAHARQQAIEQGALDPDELNSTSDARTRSQRELEAGLTVLGDVESKLAEFEALCQRLRSDVQGPNPDMASARGQLIDVVGILDAASEDFFSVELAKSIVDAADNRPSIDENVEAGTKEQFKTRWDRYETALQDAAEAYARAVEPTEFLGKDMLAYTGADISVEDVLSVPEVGDLDEFQRFVTEKRGETLQFLSTAENVLGYVESHPIGYEAQETAAEFGGQGSVDYEAIADRVGREIYGMINSYKGNQFVFLSQLAYHRIIQVESPPAVTFDPLMERIYGYYEDPKSPDRMSKLREQYSSMAGEGKSMEERSAGLDDLDEGLSDDGFQTAFANFAISLVGAPGDKGKIHLQVNIPGEALTGIPGSSFSFDLVAELENKGSGKDANEMNDIQGKIELLAGVGWSADKYTPKMIDVSVAFQAGIIAAARGDGIDEMIENFRHGVYAYLSDTAGEEVADFVVYGAGADVVDERREPSFDEDDFASVGATAEGRGGVEYDERTGGSAKGRVIRGVKYEQLDDDPDLERTSFQKSVLEGNLSIGGDSLEGGLSVKLETERRAETGSDPGIRIDDDETAQLKKKLTAAIDVSIDDVGNLDDYVELAIDVPTESLDVALSFLHDEGANVAGGTIGNFVEKASNKWVREYQQEFAEGVAQELADSRFLENVDVDVPAGKTSVEAKFELALEWTVVDGALTDNKVTIKLTKSDIASVGSRDDTPVYVSVTEEDEVFSVSFDIDE